MAMNFEPPESPSIRVTKETTARTLESTFGDGYSQRSAAGLNTIGVSFNAIWAGLSIGEADALEAFFEARNGVEAFAWRSPLDRAVVKYRCKTWSRAIAGSNAHTITATFERVFDL